MRVRVLKNYTELETGELEVYLTGEYIAFFFSFTSFISLYHTYQIEIKEEHNA